MMGCFLTILLSLFFQDDGEMDILAASLLSKVNTAGAVRNKVGRLCLGVLLCFILTDFFQRKNQSPPEGCKTKKVYRKNPSEDPDPGAPGVTLRSNPRRRQV